jgi:putative chitinase
MTTETLGRALNRASFFAAVRSSLFGGKLTEGQVQGLDALLTAAPADMPLEHLAYCLATAFHETARTMQPIKEMGGTAYFKRMYDIQGDRPTKARELGNLTLGDGARFAGRGYVQLTGKANYARASKEVGFDLVATPDLAMQAGIASVIMYSGMKAGWFTGKKLSDYFKPGLSDAYNARRIINGLDKAGDIAEYHRKFLAALNSAQIEAPAPKPAPPLPDIEPAPVPVSQPAASGGFFSALADLLKRIFA